MAYLFFLNVVMLTRLGYLMRESPAASGVTWLTCAIQVLSLSVFPLEWQLAVLAAVLIAVAALAPMLERRGHHLAGTRSLAFLLVAIAGAALLPSAGMAPWVHESMSWLSAATLGSATLDLIGWQRVNVVVFGLLLLTNEINLVIRYGFHRLSLEPKMEPEASTAFLEAADPNAAPEAAATDVRQYNAGRVIGILERYFIFIVLLAGADYAAIAVILAAKGFARFKQLDRREFAEYILIGTLASTLSAVVVALLVAHVGAIS